MVQVKYGVNCTKNQSSGLIYSNSCTAHKGTHGLRGEDIYKCLFLREVIPFGAGSGTAGLFYYSNSELKWCEMVENCLVGMRGSVLG